MGKIGYPPGFWMWVQEHKTLEADSVISLLWTGHRKVSESRRESYKELKYSSSDHEGQSGQSGGQWESTNTTNSSSVQESVERNREYYENLRKCYDPDPVIITQVIPERGSKSEVKKLYVLSWF